MNRNKLYNTPNSRFHKPILTVRRILECPHIEIHIEKYENTIDGCDLAKIKFDKIIEYLDNEHHSQFEKNIVLKESFPTYFGKGQICTIRDYFKFCEKLNHQITQKKEYEKTISELKIAQSQLDLLITQEIKKLSPKPKIDKETVTIPMIALKHYYQENKLNREEANEIIKEYGMKSGEKLYQQFCFYYEKTNRLAIPDPLTKRKLLNKIALFESVIKILPKDSKQKAIDDLATIKSKVGKEFQ